MSSRRALRPARELWRGAAAGTLLVAPLAALAHPGLPPAPHDLWVSWNPDPVILLGLTLALAGYARGALTYLAGDAIRDQYFKNPGLIS